MKITYDILIGVIDGFVPADKHEAAMRYVLENAAQSGGRRTGAGRPKGSKATAPVATAPQPTQPAPPALADENTEIIAGHQGWQFPAAVRAVAARHFTDDEIHEIEKQYSCQEWESHITVAQLVAERKNNAVAVVQQPVPEVMDEREVMFDKFWAAYPKQGKTEKRKAKQKFCALLRVRNYEAVFDEIMSGLAAYVKTDRVADGYVKGAYSWLLNEYWKTDWTVVGMKKKSVQNADRAAGIMDLIKKYK